MLHDNERKNTRLLKRRKCAAEEFISTVENSIYFKENIRKEI